MSNPVVRIGFSACFLHADPERALFKGKTLLYMEESMANWAMRHQALPVLLPQAGANFDPSDIAEGIDGLLLQGGSDVCPRTYGEEPMRPEWSGDEIRDHYEIGLIKACLEQNKPILAICRGCQILNVALGGTLYQDISTQVEGSLVHRDWDVYEDLHQEVVLEQGSALKEIYGGASTGRINSIHHQSIKDVAPGLRVEARSPEDGIIEGVCLDDSLSKEEHHQGRYALGVQWHPEFIAPKDTSLLDPGPLMNHFLEQVRATKNQK
jgi:putative glutamine amidotransferase